MNQVNVQISYPLYERESTWKKSVYIALIDVVSFIFEESNLNIFVDGFCYYLVILYLEIISFLWKLF